MTRSGCLAGEEAEMEAGSESGLVSGSGAGVEAGAVWEGAAMTGSAGWGASVGTWTVTGILWHWRSAGTSSPAQPAATHPGRKYRGVRGRSRCCYAH